MVVALLIMILLMGFVALAISRTTNETIASANDAAESRTFDASHGCLEVMTQNFSKIFKRKLSPDTTDLNRIRTQFPPGFDEYDFSAQDVQITDATQSVVLTEGQFQGLTAQRDGWRLSCPVRDRNRGTTVNLTRRFFNNRIPIFQFGIFYDDDLEFHPGPRFDFGGRVHSNGSLFLQASNRLNFSSKVTTVNHVFTDVAKNGAPWSNWNDEVYIRNASGVYQQLAFDMGSVLQNPVNGTPVTDNNPLPRSYENSTWDTDEATFQGNLLAYQKPLELPLKLNSDINALNLGLIEIIRRGKSVGDVYNDGTGTPGAPNIVPVTSTTQDDVITAEERYYNKTGIRVNLADEKRKLPGCADNAGNPIAGVCGVRLDGDATGDGAEPLAGAPRGYWPAAMTGPTAYRGTRINGDRLRIPGREVWIKIETVRFNDATQAYVTVDITKDILSMGVTEYGRRPGAEIVHDPAYGIRDSRSVIKLQRFGIEGAQIPFDNGLIGTTDSYLRHTTTGTPRNFVLVGRAANPGGASQANCYTQALVDNLDNGVWPINGFTGDHPMHRIQSDLGNATGPNRWGCVVPFPIKMFDTREGLYFEDATFNPTAAGNYRARVPWAGVMSMVDIDIGNLRRFIEGQYNGGGNPGLPASGTPFSDANGRPLRSTDIPENDGIVFYISDRRGDFDFDGQYDMEDVFGNNDGVTQPGEDINGNGTLDTDYTNEAPVYRGPMSPIVSPLIAVSPDIAAVFEHRYYRRGVRLINGRQLPGIYDSATPTNTRGFTVASENAVYVQGNYNAENFPGGFTYGTPTPATAYIPQGTSLHIPASIAADTVVILSNNWNDARSFISPFDSNNRPPTATVMRFAMLSGDTLTSLTATPHQGGGNPRMNGGVHNFKRFLEDWNNNIRLNYSGSLINLYNSHNNNGTFKCCNAVYVPPQRDWVFDSTFININRIPPGTPFFQSLQITGFQRMN